jgi:hypothetical protein
MTSVTAHPVKKMSARVSSHECIVFEFIESAYVPAGFAAGADNRACCMYTGVHAENHEGIRAKHAMLDKADVQRSRHYVLSQRSRFYLGRIDATDDAAYLAISRLVTDTFERHFDDVIVAPNPLPQEQARRNARANRCHYTLAVMLEYWDDEENEWVTAPPPDDATSARPVTSTRGVMSSRSFKSPNAKAAAKTNDDQQVRVKMTVRDSVTDQLVDAIELKSKPGYLQGIDEEAIKMLEPALKELTASLAGDIDD